MSGAQKPDTSPSKPSSPVKERSGYECAEAAAALLNCVAERSYNEMKCIPLMKKLRACIEKQGVVDFTLKPDEEEPARKSSVPMASWYERSAAWRKIVAVTKQSPAAMAAFTVFCFGAPYALGKGVMWLANPREDSQLEQLLRERANVDHKMLAKANRERLAVLLEEARSGAGGDERYAASLRGESLGTHSRGTTVGAKVIGHGSAAPAPAPEPPR